MGFHWRANNVGQEKRRNLFNIRNTIKVHMLDSTISAQFSIWSWVTGEVTCGVPLGSMVGTLSILWINETSELLYLVVIKTSNSGFKKVKSGWILEKSNELSVLVLLSREHWDLIISEDYFLSNLICLINFGFTITFFFLCSVASPTPVSRNGTTIYANIPLWSMWGSCMNARYRLGDRTVQNHFIHGGCFGEEQLKREMIARTFKDLPFRLSAVNMFTPTSL